MDLVVAAIAILLCFSIFYFIYNRDDLSKNKIKYLPSRAGDAKVGPEACSVGDGGGMAGLCPVHTMQE